MNPGEWIALAGIALAVIVPTLASWRSSIVRDMRVEGKVDTLLARVANVETELAAHCAEDDARTIRVDARLEDLGRRAHRNSNAITGQAGELARITDRIDSLKPARS